MGEAPRYQLTRVVGEARDEFLLCHEIALPRPAAHLLEARKTILIDGTDITPGSVLLQGRLRVIWTYQIAETPTSGPLWATTTDVPFTVRLTVPGASAGMECRVTEAHVTADASEVPSLQSIRERSLVAIGVEVTAEEVVTQGHKPMHTTTAQRSAIIGRFATKN